MTITTKAAETMTASELRAAIAEMIELLPEFVGCAEIERGGDEDAADAAVRRALLRIAETTSRTVLNTPFALRTERAS